MQICRALAGYSYGRADIVRRAMSKKKLGEMSAEREAFLSGCADNGVDAEVAGQIFDQMQAFASYAFNKSHAAAYAYLTYRTAYCRRFYPAQFYAAQLSAFCENTGKTAGHIEVCRRMGIRILPPDINKAEANFTEESGAIRFGLRAVKGVGLMLARKIVSEREQNGNFTSFEDFCARMGGRECGKLALQSLVYAGAFDGFTEHNRNEMASVGEELLKDGMQNGRMQIAGQISLFESEPQPTAVVWPNRPEPGMQERLEQEKQAVGFYLSGHPLDAVPQTALPFNLQSVSQLASVEGETLLLGIPVSLKEIRTKKGERMAFAALSDRSGTVEVILFADVFGRYESLITKDRPVFVYGTPQTNEEGRLQLVASRLASIEQMQTTINHSGKRVPVTVYIRVPSEQDERLSALPKLLAAHPGEDEVCLYFEDTDRYLKMRQYRIFFDKSMAKTLKNIFGENSIVDKKRKNAENC